MSIYKLEITLGTENSNGQLSFSLRVLRFNLCGLCVKLLQTKI